MTLREAILLIRHSPVDWWPNGFKHLPAFREAFRAMADEAFLRGPEYPGHVRDRGVVVCGGGKFYPGACTVVGVLRKLGCNLPVQVWYFGEGERDEKAERLLDKLDAEVWDGTAVPGYRERRGVKGFQCKLFAVANSWFREVLSLDSDCFPLRDPSVLFDCPKYRSAGGTYWPDGPGTSGWTHWALWMVEKSGPDFGFETGQYVLNREQVWPIFRLAYHYDNYPEFYYAPPGGDPNGGDYGDKGPHRVAWARAGKIPAHYATEIVYKMPSFIQPGPDGEPMFNHRVEGKMNPGNHTFTSNQMVPHAAVGNPGDEMIFDVFRGVRYALLGRHR